MSSKTIWNIISVIELAAIVAAVLLDLFIPTLVILGLMLVSLLMRHEHIAGMGFKRPPFRLEVAGFIFLGVVLLQLFQVGVTMPVLKRLTGTTIDYSGFAQLQGNLGQLLLFLALSWTLAAVGEELAYRGYVEKRLGSLFGNGAIGVALTVGITSLLFGLAHTEQGLTGVIVTTLDALCFSWLKHKCNGNLWAAILAHGFYNSIGIITFYCTGPIYGLW